MWQPELYPEAIVWDLDGTLVESAPDLAHALNTLLNEQGQNGHPVLDVRIMIGAGVTKLIERGFRAAGTPIDDLIPHAREVLHHFYHAGFRQGLCTNKPYAVTMQILNALDIAGYFSSIVGGDSTSEKKPHPLPLQTCLEELRVSSGVSVMIGDSGADVGAARAAGVPVILVPDGYTGAPAVSLGADSVVGSLAELPASIVPRRPLRQSA